MIIGLALIESLVIYAFLVTFVKIKVCLLLSIKKTSNIKTKNIFLLLLKRIAIEETTKTIKRGRKKSSILYLASRKCYNLKKQNCYDGDAKQNLQNVY